VINEELLDLSNVYLIPPQPYSRFVLLLMECLFVISDSGGIQEECVSLGKQALVTRNMTERGEGIESGFLRMVSTNEDKIFKLASALIINPTSEIKFGTNPYGEGEISKGIVDKILKKYH
jgi:UDP-N-acetylglucosamine 2-epimerase (non-hydrolysing)